jgi:hypothetical protein
MKRRTVLVLTGMTLLSLAIAGLPQPGFAQSDPFLGTWQLNLTKSKWSPGPRSLTVTIQAEGQNHKFTGTGINAQGNPFSAVNMWIYDGVSHPVTNDPAFDAVAHTRVDAYTVIGSYTKAGKLVQILTDIVSQDGKTATATFIGTNANGQQINEILMVYDKQ